MLEGLTLPALAPWTTRMSWFVYVVRVAGRDGVIAALERYGVPARQYFPPIHLQPFYRERFGYQPGDFPLAEAAGDTCLALPFFATILAGLTLAAPRLLFAQQAKRVYRIATLDDATENARA